MPDTTDVGTPPIVPEKGEQLNNFLKMLAGIGSLNRSAVNAGNTSFPSAATVARPGGAPPAVVPSMPGIGALGGASLPMDPRSTTMPQGPAAMGAPQMFGTSGATAFQSKSARNAAVVSNALQSFANFEQRFAQQKFDKQAAEARKAVGQEITLKRQLADPATSPETKQLLQQQLQQLQQSKDYQKALKGVNKPGSPAFVGYQQAAADEQARLDADKKREMQQAQIDEARARASLNNAQAGIEQERLKYIASLPPDQRSRVLFGTTSPNVELKTTVDGYPLGVVDVTRGGVIVPGDPRFTESDKRIYDKGMEGYDQKLKKEREKQKDIETRQEARDARTAKRQEEADIRRDKERQAREFRMEAAKRRDEEFKEEQKERYLKLSTESKKDVQFMSARLRANAPPNAIKVQTASAGDVLTDIAKLRDEVDKLQAAGKLGPGRGRASDIWNNKGGFRAPDYEQFRMDFVALGGHFQKMMSASVMGGGSPANLQEMENIFREVAADPDNIRAKLDSMDYAANEKVRTGQMFSVMYDFMQGSREDVTGPHKDPYKDLKLPGDPEKTTKKTLSEDEAKRFFEQAGGDPAKARKLATEAGYEVK